MINRKAFKFLRFRVTQSGALSLKRNLSGRVSAFSPGHTHAHAHAHEHTRTHNTWMIIRSSGFQTFLEANLFLKLDPTISNWNTFISWIL